MPKALPVVVFCFFVSKILYESSSEESSGEDGEQEKKDSVLDLEDLGPMMNSMRKAKVINNFDIQLWPQLTPIFTLLSSWNPPYQTVHHGLWCVDVRAY